MNQTTFDTNRRPDKSNRITRLGMIFRLIPFLGLMTFIDGAVKSRVLRGWVVALGWADAYDP